MTSQRTDMTPATDVDEANPYRSPMMPCDAVEKPLIAASGTFHWRVIPVCLLYFFGTAMALSGLAAFGIESLHVCQGKGPSRDMGLGIMVVPGLLYLYAGRKLWKGPVLRGLFFVLLAVAAHVGFAFAAEYVLGMH